jgi:hypothetical protein
MVPVLLIVLLVLMVGGFPMWPYTADWGVGYWPSGLLGLAFVVLLVWALTNGSFSRRRGPPIV